MPALHVQVLAYALSPLDLIPDFIPILGLLDDLLLLPGLIWLAIHLIPKEASAHRHSQADRQRGWHRGPPCRAEAASGPRHSPPSAPSTRAYHMLRISAPKNATTARGGRTALPALAQQTVQQFVAWPGCHSSLACV